MEVDALAQAALAAVGVAEPHLTARHGWANEAWIGDRHVVRISSGRFRASFSHEAAVVERLAGSGVPVAQVIAWGSVDDLPLDLATSACGREWIVSRRLGGETVATVWPTLSAGERRAFGVALGQSLRALHQQPLCDLAPRWWLDAQQIPEELHNAYRPRVAMGPRLVEAARHLTNADDPLLDDVAFLLAERMELFDHDVDVFVHGDLHGHNVMTDPGGSIAITGILDWEGAHGAAADVELDMFLRYVAGADHFPERPGAPAAIAAGDMIELGEHVAVAYPDLLGHPRLRERLEVYDAHWHLVQLLVRDRLDPPATAGDAAWQRLRELLDGRSHIATFL